MFEPLSIVSKKQTDLLSLISRLDRSIDGYVTNAKNRLAFEARVLNYDKQIQSYHERLKKKLKDLVLRQNNCDVDAMLSHAEKDFANDISKLELLNPLFILSKGYSVTKDSMGKIAKVENLKQGDTITTLLDGGSVESTVQKVLLSDKVNPKSGSDNSKDN